MARDSKKSLTAGFKRAIGEILNLHIPDQPGWARLTKLVAPPPAGSLIVSTNRIYMTAIALEASNHSLCRSLNKISWRDADTGCEIVLAHPAGEPELWEEFVKGAQRSYRKHGVECALSLDTMRDGEDTALFYVALDHSGQVVGGLRAKGPYRDADESHAVLEWAGHPGEDAVRKMITDRLPFGVVEMKSAWVSDAPDRSQMLTRTLARTAFPTMAVLGAQFILATAAAHVLDRWRSSGGVVATKVPAAPYPNRHYHTRIMWWDRSTFANHAEPMQLSKILREMRNLAALSDDFSDFGIQYGGGV